MDITSRINGQFVAQVSSIDMKTVQTIDVKAPAERLLVRRVTVIGRSVDTLSNGATVNLTEISNDGVAAVAASLSTNLTGSNNDLTFTARTAGVAGNSITIRYVDPAANSASISVSRSGTAITVSLATNGGGSITSTAAQVKAAIEASLYANALVSIANKAANDGTGVVTAMAATALASGADPVATTTRQTIVASVDLADTDANGTTQELTVASGVKPLQPDSLIRINVTGGATATTATHDVLIEGTVLPV